jgi:hypothetical protein
MDVPIDPPSPDSAEALLAFLRRQGLANKGVYSVGNCTCGGVNTFTVNHATRGFKCSSCGAEGAVNFHHPAPSKATNGADAGAEKIPEALGVALTLAAAGLPIIPVSVYWNQAKQKWDKVPCIEDWPNEASTDPFPVEFVSLTPGAR